MRIVLDDTYRGHVIDEVLEPGEHEVPDAVGAYLIETFSGSPIYARLAEPKEAEDVETEVADELEETKVITPPENKLDIPDEIKDETATAKRGSRKAEK
jgi:hypothetical protein